MLDRPATVYADAFALAFDQAIGPTGDLSPEQIRDRVAAAELAAREHAVDQVAGQLYAEARRLAEQAERRRERRERERAERDRVEKDARKRLKRIRGGGDVDPAGEYWLVTHPAGAVAYPKDPDQPVQPPPVVAGKRCGQRGATGAELAQVEALAGVVADHREARAVLDTVARDWSPPELVGAGIVEDPE